MFQAPCTLPVWDRVGHEALRPKPVCFRGTDLQFWAATPQPLFESLALANGSIAELSLGCLGMQGDVRAPYHHLAGPTVEISRTTSTRR